MIEVYLHMIMMLDVRRKSRTSFLRKEGGVDKLGPMDSGLQECKQKKQPAEKSAG